MTNVAKARESAIAAETRVEQTVLKVLDRLHVINTRLVALHGEIKQAQPVASGSVCLELYPCGPGCAGCPHPRWVKYTWTEGTPDKPGIMLGINLDAQNRDPVLTLARKAAHYPQTAKLIREAKTILDERTKILASIRGLRYSARL
ncbi:hypothetical protein G3A43_06310 [Paraburkholderia aspalathi]|nr:hypothetical protein [Paraburkholderia aspalathi]MBK3779861.1 hypothetical protein [Paraburkholderia aspalathi]